jgi:hypothetical protein
MTVYAHVTDNTITATSGRLPNGARRLDTGAWVIGLVDADEPTRQATGWAEVIATARPDDTDTVTHDRSVELVDGVPTVVWTQRPFTVDELAARAEAAAFVPVETRVAELEAELRAMRERVAAVEVVSAEAMAIRDAIKPQTAKP